MSVVSRLHSAHFLISAPDLKHCPPDIGREVAFAGRSNAGKSTAINRITGQPKLAKTSKTPGRTQMINFFALEEGGATARLVDLPGYGFAKVPKAMKEKWQRNMSEYLAERETLCGLVLLMDIRHPLKEFDVEMIEWADRNDMPLHILLTKSDKLKNGPAKATLLKIRKQLAGLHNPVSIQLFSALKNQGVQEAQNLLGEWLHLS